MSLIKCPGCSNHISELESNCPNCDYPLTEELVIQIRRKEQLEKERKLRAGRKVESTDISPYR